MFVTPTREHFHRFFPLRARTADSMQQPPLTSALVVTHSNPVVGALPHVTTTVSAFLDRSIELSLAQACSFSSLRLLQRIWDGSQAADLPATSLWCQSVLMWSNLHYYRHQFAQSMIEAAKLGDLSMVQWLFERFSDCGVPVEAVEEAARRDQRHILQFLETYRNKHQHNTDNRAVKDEDKPHEVNLWDGGALLAVATSGHEQLVRWMLGEVCDGYYGSKNPNVTNQIGRYGDAEMMQRLMAHRWRPPRLDFVAEGGNLDMMDQVLGRRSNAGKRWALKNAATNGHLDVVKLLVREDLVYLEGPAFSGAADNGHLAVVRWLKDKNLGLSTANHALDLAASNGHLETATYLRKECGASFSSNTMRGAARSGHLSMVRWLYAQSTDQPKTDLFKSGSCKQLNTTAMDEVAKNGHLHVLEYLHEVATSMALPTVGDKRKRSTGKGANGKILPTCTPAAIQLTAIGGHLDVMQWLHTHYWAEPSTDAMDIAASNGHLPMVKWLHEHAAAGCTTTAMDSAAKGGHLATVQWLHFNRTEGCTKKAMDDAASQGHLSVVKWLHENRSEGCSTKAMDGAADGGHFDMVLFLASKRTELCSAGRKHIHNRHISAWMNDKYPDHFIPDPNERYDPDRIDWTRMVRDMEGWQTGV
ncbi:hypothetical protein BBJ28_00015513 [Nothophytophthora sp. Chile5]|nr:hypothetical protein BBJ28_00015513 [Nothophytophthora sp. Chile5]